MRTDWSRRGDPAAYQNFDETGQHTPGPSAEAVRFLVEDRDVLGFGSEAIGKGVVETLKKYPKSPAVLMQNHGPFTIGKDAEGAVKAAAMTEEVAHTMWAARQLGDIIEIDQADIDKLNDRYQNVYGQH